MLRLRCTAQTYDWGLDASSSEVAELASCQGQSVDSEMPYAELWMGTHDSGPSSVVDNYDGIVEGDTFEVMLLKQWLSENRDALGTDPDGPVRRLISSPESNSENGSTRPDNINSVRNQIDLPFLFKVLSVRKALSIQAHPDKQRAEQLNAERPHVYKDPNHKPEMTVAITTFEAMCGFVAASELVENFNNVPELRQIVGNDIVEKYRDSVGTSLMKERLQEAFSSLMLAEKDKVEAAVVSLVNRLDEKSSDERTKVEQMVLRLHEQYPFDVGIFCAFFLNIITLQPNQGVSLEANVPHAYLSGQCVEVMATSDNVVRAGLTPKLRDTGVLCDMLTYDQGLPKILEGISIDNNTSLFSPPFDEFELYKIKIDINQTYKQFVRNESPSILLCLQGENINVKCTDFACDVKHVLREIHCSRGTVLFVVAGALLEITTTSTDALFYQASCNRRIFQKHNDDL